MVGYSAVHGSGSNGRAVQAWIAWPYSRRARTIAVSMYMCSMYVWVIGVDDRGMGGGVQRSASNGSGSNGRSSTGCAVQAWIAWPNSRRARTIAVSMYMCSKYVCVIGVDGRGMGGGTAQCQQWEWQQWEQQQHWACRASLQHD